MIFLHENALNKNILRVRYEHPADPLRKNISLSFIYTYELIMKCINYAQFNQWITEINLSRDNSKLQRRQQTGSRSGLQRSAEASGRCRDRIPTAEARTSPCGGRSPEGREDGATARSRGGRKHAFSSEVLRSARGRVVGAGVRHEICACVRCTWRRRWSWPAGGRYLCCVRSCRHAKPWRLGSIHLL